MGFLDKAKQAANEMAANQELQQAVADVSQFYATTCPDGTGSPSPSPSDSAK